MAELRWATGTHEGQVREINEDAAFANPSLFVVADGMGGHLAGEVASSMAIETLERELDNSSGQSLDDLVAAISLANQRIFADATENPEHAGMGTTVTAIAVITDRYDGEALGVANVGDSRIYLFRHNRLRQVTIDHSFVQELIAEGAISAAEARHHPRRNIVTRGLGIESGVRVDSWTLPLIRGDRFLLCSDGLSDYVVEDDVARTLADHPADPAAAVVALINQANAAGGPDNITVVIVDVLDGEEPPDPTEEIDIVPEWFDEDLDDTEDSLIIADPLPDEDFEEGPSWNAVDPMDTSDGSVDVPDPEDGYFGSGRFGGEFNDSSDVLAESDIALGDVTADVTTEVAEVEDAKPTQKKAAGRRSRLAQFVLLVGLAAVLVGGFSVLAAWARGGYFVAFDDAGVVTVYKGRNGGFLWFEPTVETTGDLTRSEMDDASVEKVEKEPTFGSLANAQRFVVDQLRARPGLVEEDNEVTWPRPQTSNPTSPRRVPPAPTTNAPAKTQNTRAGG